MLTVFPEMKTAYHLLEDATFVELYVAKTRRILTLDRLRLEDVASGYWTLPFKQSSGLVSHYGSTPPSSARLLDKIISWYNRSA